MEQPVRIVLWPTHRTTTTTTTTVANEEAEENNNGGLFEIFEVGDE